MWNRWVSVLLFIGFVFSSCGTKKKGMQVVPPTDKTSQVVLDGGITINNLDFYTFSGKAKTNLELGEEKMDATMHIRIDKDKAIWISITATVLNLEVARLLITQDSVKILDKFHSVYYEKPFSFIQQYTTEGIDFLLLQATLLGNTNERLLRTDKLTVAQSDEEIQVIGLRDRLFFQYGLGEGNHVSSFLLSSEYQGKSVQALYSDFDASSGYTFARSQTFLLRNDLMFVKAVLTYQSVDFNRVVDMPFAVPARYKLVD